MTQEEKVRAYDEALEKARKELGICGSLDCDAARQIFRFFPQLAESEDERTRKALIETVKCIYAGDTMFLSEQQRDRYLNWLEKQKEPVVDKEGMYYYLGGKFIYCGYPATEENPYDFAMSQQEKQKEQKPADLSEMMVHKEPYIAPVSTPMVADEQKPAEWSEEDIKKIRSEEYTKGFNDAAFVGKIKEWSVEDEDRIRQIERIAQEAGCTQKLQEEIHDWLKSIRKQAKQEWNEEEIIYWNTIKDYFFGIPLDDKLKSALDWLKSLRPSWKPSEEQMEALNVLNLHGDLSYVGQQNQLISLYNDLKKLM